MERVGFRGAALQGCLVIVTVIVPGLAALRAQAPTLASTTDWRHFPHVAADVVLRWHPSADSVSPPVVSGTGPAIQVQTTAAATLLRTDWTLSGTYAAGATFTPAVDAAPVEFGVVVGSGALACIVAPDGTARFDAHGSTLSVASVAAVTASTEILVRVTDAGVACEINGQPALTTVGSPKGAPGIYVGRSGLVLVAGFTVETAPDQTGGR